MERFDQKFCARITESWDGIETNEFISFLVPKCQEIFTPARLRQRLTERCPLRVKFGIDPTGSDVHLGHVVPIMLLQQFAKAGHEIDLVIGDFTARIGDPTSRVTSRDQLDEGEIRSNLSTYGKQIGKYINMAALKVHQNEKWLSAMSLSEVFNIFQGINLSEAMQREDFRSRMKNGQTVSLAEACYGVLMGIDSMHLQSHIEVGGIDQLLNFQQCRSVMRQQGVEEEVVLMVPILEGTSGDGKKMSKSYNNYIAVTASLEEKFGKIMSIPDRLIEQYFKSFADIHEGEIADLERFIAADPLEAKKQLATLVIAIETKEIEDGLNERESFERRFTQKNIRDEDCSTIFTSGNETVIDAFMRSGRFKSRSELRRLFEQQAVRLCIGGEERAITSDHSATSLYNGTVRVGKRRFFKFCSRSS